MSSAESMRDVIGRIPDGIPGTLSGMKLCIQKLDELPKATQEILHRKWPADFRSYTLVPQVGSSLVGMLWAITPEERNMIEKWELVDTGWYQVAAVQVKAENGEVVDATTEIMGPNQSYSFEVDGGHYSKLLNAEEDRARIAKEVREGI